MLLQGTAASPVVLQQGNTHELLPLHHADTGAYAADDNFYSYI
jgi:hypothetical protein